MIMQVQFGCFHSKQILLACPLEKSYNDITQTLYRIISQEIEIMEVLQLKYFQVVAKYENMTMAAKELNIVQPAVSQSIRRLEKELGLSLFDRIGKKIQLNDAGRHLLKHLPEVLEPLARLSDEMAAFRESDGEIRRQIVLSVKSTSMLIPGLLSAYSKIHPEVAFNIVNQEEEWDICITSFMYNVENCRELGANVTEALLLREEILLACEKTHLNEGSTVANLRFLADQRFVGLKQGQVFRDMTDVICMADDVSLQYAYESDSPALVRNILDSGGVAAFYPQLTWGPIKNPEIKCYSIEGGPYQRDIVIRQKNKNKPWLASFYSFTKSYYKNLLNQSWGGRDSV